jgi:hypothetical protein
MTKRYLFLVFTLLSSVIPLFAQREVSKCKDVDTPEFRQFDREFRLALQHKDAVALSFLASFPLRVNSPRGSIQIDDAQSLSGHFDQIFTPDVIKNILSTGQDYLCRGDMGIAYGPGSAWISNSDIVEKKNGHPVIQLYVVNTSGPPAPASSVVYACRTAKHRIVIDQLPSDRFRYRSGDIPKPLTDKPDVDLANGTSAIEGTGVCAYQTYTFQNGNVTYEVDQGVGCGERPAPKGVTGSLTVSINGKVASGSDCL